MTMALIRQLILLLVLRCIMKRMMRLTVGSLMWLSVWEGIHRIGEGIGGRLLMLLVLVGMLGKGLGRVGRISCWIEVGGVRDIVGRVMVGHGQACRVDFDTDWVAERRVLAVP